MNKTRDYLHNIKNRLNAIALPVRLIEDIADKIDTNESHKITEYAQRVFETVSGIALLLNDLEKYLNDKA